MSHKMRVLVVATGDYWDTPPTEVALPAGAACAHARLLGRVREYGGFIGCGCRCPRARASQPLTSGACLTRCGCWWPQSVISGTCAPRMSQLLRVRGASTHVYWDMRA